MKERDCQAALVQALRLLGGDRVLVTHIPNQVALPAGIRRNTPRYFAWLAALEEQGYDFGAADLVVSWSGGDGLAARCLFVEVKAPNIGRERQTQKRWHARAAAIGIPALIWDDGNPATAVAWLRMYDCPLRAAKL